MEGFFTDLMRLMMFEAAGENRSGIFSALQDTDVDAIARADTNREDNFVIEPDVCQEVGCVDRSLRRS
jgi:hypothetical protein